MIETVVKINRRRRSQRGAPNKVKNAGSRREQIKRYYATTYQKRKISHLLKNNGYDAAWQWACERNCTYLVPSKSKG